MRVHARVRSHASTPSLATADTPRPRRHRLRTTVAVLAALPVIASLAVVGSAPRPAEGTAGQPSAEMALTVAGVPVRNDSVIDDGTTVNVGVSGLLTPGTTTRELRASLDPGMQYQAGGAEAPEGWAIEYSTNDGATWSPSEPSPAAVTDVRARASVTAGAIAGYSQLYSSTTVASIPSSSFTGSTGGDGWDVFFSDDFVFNIFHHDGSRLILDCHLRSTGARCAGYTATFNGYRTSMRSGGWVDSISGKLYAFTSDTATNSAGVLCVDITSTPTSCGYTALTDDTGVNSYGYLSEADFIGRRLFGIETAGTGSLLCFDAALGDACPGSPIALDGAVGNTGDDGSSRVQRVGSKIIAKTSTKMYCFEGQTLAPCNGDWPIDINGNQKTPVAPHTDAAGTINGVCWHGGCFDLTGAATAWTNPFSLGTSNWAMHAVSGAQTQNRYFYVGDNQYDVECFDYATNAGCAGFPITYPGEFQIMYTIRQDPENPSCMWVNSDGGQIRVFDAFSGAPECTANPVITLQPSSFAPRFTCSTNDSIDEWRTLRLVSLGGTGTPATVALTVRNAQGNAVPGWTAKPVTLGVPLDMTGLDVTSSGSRPTFSFAFGGVAGGNITTATIALNYTGKGPELCVRTQLEAGTSLCPILVGLDGSLIDGISPAHTFTVRRQFTIGTDVRFCPENIVPQIAPSVPRNLTAALSGTDVLLRFLPPADNGGAELREYKYSINGGTTYATATVIDNGDGSRGLALHGLTRGTTYGIEIRATNVIGRSAPATYTLVVPSQVAQTIALTDIGDTPVTGGPFVLPATTDASLPITWTAGPASVCTISGSTVTLVGAGTCAVDGSQAGDAGHLPVTASTSFDVTLIQQVVTIPGIGDIALDQGPVLLPATTDDGLPLTYTAGPSTVCTVEGNVLTLVGAGTCTLVANQAGDATHTPATSTVVFVVRPPLLNLQLQVQPGEAVADAPVEVSGDGLKPFSEVRIELHSTPVLLGTATTDANGSFRTTVRMPSQVPAGSHEIVALGIAPDDRSVTAVQPVFIDWSGSFGEIRTTGGFTAITPTRVLDTREAAGPVAAGPVAAGTVQRVTMPAGLLPVDVTGIAINVAVTDPLRSGYVTVYPCSADRPVAAAVNFVAGQTVSNLVDTVHTAASELCVFSSATANVVIDLEGYHSTSGSSRLDPRIATRVLDTRTSGPRVERGQVVAIDVVGDGLAPEGTTAVSLNLAVDGPERAGFLTAFPCGVDRPWAASLDFAGGQTASNEVVVGVGTGGTVCVYSSSATDLVVDLGSVFRPEASDRFTALVPGRLGDTRSTAKMLAGQTVEWRVVGATSAPAGTTALALNIAVTEPETAGFLTVFPCGSPRPWASSLNFAAGQTVSNHVTATVGTGGTICVYSLSDVHVVIDVEGTYSATPG